MARAILLAFGFLRCRLWRIVSLGAVLAAAVLVGVNWWAWHHFRAAEQALRHENLEEASGHISRCLHVWRRGSETHLLAARIDRASGRFAEAEQHLNECIRLQHGASEQTQLETFLLRAQTGELREVEKGLWNCVNAGHPDSPRILETLAQIYLRELRMEAALECLSRWSALDPHAARPWHWRGWVYEYLGHAGFAISNYEKAVELDPRRWGARMRLALLYLENNNPEPARPHLQELLRSHGDELNVQIAQAHAFRLEGKPEEAIDLLDQLLQTHPNHFESLYLRGHLASQHDPPRYAEAEGFLRRALAEHPVDLPTLHTLSQCLEHLGKAKEAAEVHAKHERIQKDSKRLAEMKRKFEVERAPQNPDVLAEMGHLLLKLGDEEKGLQLLGRAIKACKTHRPSYEIVIHYYETHGNKEEAERIRKRFFELTGNKIDDAPRANN